MRLKISQKLKDIKRSPETKAKMKIAQKINASKFTKEHRTKQAKTLTGRKASNETRLKMSLAQRGENGSNWQGGITPLYLAIRHHCKMREWIEACFRRDDFTCQKCGSYGKNLNCHHIDSFASIIKRFNIKTLEQALFCWELWRIENGVTLCKECHDLIHKKNGK